jgi:hypothetical protein
MTKPNRRDVSPRGGGKGWKVTKPGVKTPASEHRTQAAAERAATRDLHRTGGGERVTHGRDGAIRSKDTIRPGRDPNPPRDKEH